MRRIEHGVLVSLRTVKSKEDFWDLCGGLKDNDEADRLYPDILALPEVIVSTDHVESFGIVDGLSYLFDGEVWTYTLVNVVTASGREYLAVSVAEDLSDLGLRDD